MNKPKLVGILNLTPDSFSDGDRYIHESGKDTGLQEVGKATIDAIAMFRAEARYVDVGGESTRPGARPITPELEFVRIGAVACNLIRAYPGRIMIDSYHPEIHRRIASYDWGDFIVNDVTGFNNPEMVAVADEIGMGCVVSHLPAEYGTDIQAAHQSDHPVDSIEAVARELLHRQQELVDAGIPKHKIILDPGIGFGKTMGLNTKLLEFPAYIKQLDPTVKVMVGYSRKRFLGDNRMELEPNLAAGRTAIASGADYLRIHDVAGHKQLLSNS